MALNNLESINEMSSKLEAEQSYPLFNDKQHKLPKDITYEQIDPTVRDIDDVNLVQVNDNDNDDDVEQLDAS